jgi:hypothetical protein
MNAYTLWLQRSRTFPSVLKKSVPMARPTDSEERVVLNPLTGSSRGPYVNAYGPYDIRSPSIGAPFWLITFNLGITYGQHG